MTKTKKSDAVRRAALEEAIDTLERIHASSFDGMDGAEIRATLVEKLRDLGQIPPSWDPEQYKRAKLSP